VETEQQRGGGKEAKGKRSAFRENKVKQMIEGKAIYEKKSTKMDGPREEKVEQINHHRGGEGDRREKKMMSLWPEQVNGRGEN